jgi:hypothetical protein
MSTSRILKLALFYVVVFVFGLAPAYSQVTNANPEMSHRFVTFLFCSESHAILTKFGYSLP